MCFRYRLLGVQVFAPFRGVLKPPLEVVVTDLLPLETISFLRTAMCFWANMCFHPVRDKHSCGSGSVYC